MIKWWPVENPDDSRTKNVSENVSDISGISFEEIAIHTERVLVGDLMPGVEYFFVVYTISYDLVSDISNLTTRTSEYTSFVFVISDDDGDLVAMSVSFSLFDSSLTNFA